MSGKREIDGDGRIGGRFSELLVAVGFMTRLPIPFREGSISTASWAFPFAGALVGAIAGAALWIAHSIGMPPLAVAFVALAVSAMTTGALHEDGLADCADGFWGGATPDRRLEIMRDSRSGAFGVLALVLTTGLKASLLATLVAQWGGMAAWSMLIAIHALSRAGLPAAMALTAPPGKTGLAAMAGRPDTGTAVAGAIFGLGIVWIAMPWGPVWLPPVLAAASAVSVLAVGWLAQVKIKGINGDSLGGMEQVAEIACLIALTVLLGR